MRSMRGEGFSDWLKALRSGEYEQGDGRLLTKRPGDDGSEPTNEFCVLGVAHDTYLKHVGGQWDGGVAIMPGLPDPSAKWVFNSADDEHVFADNTLANGFVLQGWYSISELNDVYGATFVEIANIVENHVLKQESTDKDELIAGLKRMNAQLAAELDRRIGIKPTTPT